VIGRGCEARVITALTGLDPTARLLAATLIPATTGLPMLVSIRPLAGGGDLDFMAAGGTDPEVSGGSDRTATGKKQREMRAFRSCGTPVFLKVTLAVGCAPP
jgi:hypothetical protein